MQVKDLTWKENVTSYDQDYNIDMLHIAAIDNGYISVLDRMTGFGYRDIETGYRDKDGLFWLASGNFDIREYPDYTVEEAIELIKVNANNCKGI